MAVMMTKGDVVARGTLYRLSGRRDDNPFDLLDIRNHEGMDVEWDCAPLADHKFACWRPGFFSNQLSDGFVCTSTVQEIGTEGPEGLPFTTKNSRYLLKETPGDG